MALHYNKELVLQDLHHMSEHSFQEFSSGLMGVPVKMLGVRLPRLRAYAKEIAKADGFSYLSETELTNCTSGAGCDDTGVCTTEAHSLGTHDTGLAALEAHDTGLAASEAPYMEEIMLYGMVIGHMKAGLDDLFPYIRKYVGLIDNWSTCDSFCCGLNQTKKEPEKMWQFLQSYLTSDEEYELRFGVVMLMDFYITPDYIDKLLEIYDGIQHEGYYVKMAVAWALSVCFVKFWDKTLAYMQSGDNHLDDFTYNKTLQKCRESYRITAQQKEILLAMKRGK